MQVTVPGERVASNGEGTAVTIGAYDGVHVGHRRILELLVAEAAVRGLRSAVVTFDRHPATVVRPESAPLLLTDTDHKLELLAACGVDLTVVVPFDERRASEDAVDFVDEVLVGDLGARLVVVGENFHWGNGRKGDVPLLAELGAARGFDVRGVPLESVGEPVSSTRIRRLVAEGNVRDAAALLARPHEVRGTVVRGDGRGGPELGYPTANVAVPEGMAVPAVGIYAGWYRHPDGSSTPAAISVGRRPTFYPDADAEGAPGLVEAHLLDFHGDLYGERAGVAFAERLRDERRFAHVGDLVAQMAQDMARTRSLLA